MKIYRENNKRAYLHLLLLADEQESLINRYLDNGTMYVLDDNGVKAIIVVCDAGDSSLTVPFYEKCGFKRSYVVKNFFTDNYDHRIIECGKQLVDMIYLVKKLI